jgi:hypothetical protein
MVNRPTGYRPGYPAKANLRLRQAMSHAKGRPEKKVMAYLGQTPAVKDLMVVKPRRS